MKRINIHRGQTNTKLSIWVFILLGGLIGFGVFWLNSFRPGFSRTANVIKWINNPMLYPEWSIQALEQCPGAPFILPTDGLVGYLWDDSFRLGQRHQGIDIFAGTQPGITPVYAASDGFLTRQPGWKSAVILRIPDDPLMPGRQIWLYYTHMADRHGSSYIVKNFPPGTVDKPVKAGDLIGYQGNYSGYASNPVGVHLHFSIVRDNGLNSFLNELEIKNTLDPSPYLGLMLNAKQAGNSPTACLH